LEKFIDYITYPVTFRDSLVHIRSNEDWLDESLFLIFFLSSSLLPNSNSEVFVTISLRSGPILAFSSSFDLARAYFKEVLDIPLEALTFIGIWCSVIESDLYDSKRGSISLPLWVMVAKLLFSSAITSYYSNDIFLFISFLNTPLPKTLLSFLI